MVNMPLHFCAHNPYLILLVIKWYNIGIENKVWYMYVYIYIYTISYLNICYHANHFQNNANYLILSKYGFNNGCSPCFLWELSAAIAGYMYRHIPSKRCTLAGNKNVYHSDVVGATPLDIHLHSCLLYYILDSKHKIDGWYSAQHMNRRSCVKYVAGERINHLLWYFLFVVICTIRSSLTISYKYIGLSGFRFCLLYELHDLQIYLMFIFWYF